MKYLSREKVNLGTARIQSTTDGFLKEFKLDIIQGCKNNGNFYSSKHPCFFLN